jgi:hypothetical protein
LSVPDKPYSASVTNPAAPASNFFSSTHKWHLSRDGRSYGLFSVRELMDLFNSGGLRPDDLLSAAGDLWFRTDLVFSFATRHDQIRPVIGIVRRVTNYALFVVFVFWYLLKYLVIIALSLLAIAVSYYALVFGFVFVVFVFFITASVYLYISIRYQRPVIYDEHSFTTLLSSAFLAAIATTSLSAGTICVDAIFDALNIAGITNVHAKWKALRPVSGNAWWYGDAARFCIAATLVLFISSRVHLYVQRHPNSWVCVLPSLSGAVIFLAADHYESIIHIDKGAGAVEALRHLITLMLDVIASPVIALQSAIRDYANFGIWLTAEVIETRGSLFRLLAILPKLLWLVFLLVATRTLMRRIRPPVG